jgi:hypothetical protein
MPWILQAVLLPLYTSGYTFIRVAVWFTALYALPVLPSTRRYYGTVLDLPCGGSDAHFPSPSPCGCRLAFGCSRVLRVLDVASRVLPPCATCRFTTRVHSHSFLPPHTFTSLHLHPHVYDHAFVYTNVGRTTTPPPPCLYVWVITTRFGTLCLRTCRTTQPAVPLPHLAGLDLGYNTDHHLRLFSPFAGFVPRCPCAFG